MSDQTAAPPEDEGAVEELFEAPVRGSATELMDHGAAGDPLRQPPGRGGSGTRRESFRKWWATLDSNQ